MLEPLVSVVNYSCERKKHKLCGGPSNCTLDCKWPSGLGENNNVKSLEITYKDDKNMNIKINMPVCQLQTVSMSNI